MTGPPPPAAIFDPINLKTVAAGTSLHRLHADWFGGDEFNPCQGLPCRFAPIYDMQGRCVPSLYAATTFECATFESVFHDVPYNATTKTVPMSRVADRAHSEIAPARDLNLIMLHEPDLNAWNVTRGSLIDTLACFYAETARWAQALHRAKPTADGLIWTSRRYDPDQSILLFGDRFAPADLDVLSRREAISDPQLISDIRSIGRRANISIVL